MSLNISSTHSPRRILLALTFVAGAFGSSGGLAQSTPASPHAGHTAASATKAHGDGASMAMHATMKDMHKKMEAMKMTGNVDMDFAMMMVSHHQGAIDMAQAELDHGKDPQMLKAAKKIIAAQKKEIAMFEAWMKAHSHKK